MKGVTCDVWAKHCGTDLPTDVVHYSSKEGIERRIAVFSVYFPSDAEESSPPQQVRDLIRDCKVNGLVLVIGCDAYAHNTAWERSDCNNREEALLEFLVTANSEICKQAASLRSETQ